MRRVLPFVPFAAALVPALALAAQLRTFADLAGFLVNILNSGTALLVLAGVVIYFFGISSNIFKIQKGDPTAARNSILWGIAILFVMVSIWGIVAMVRETIFSSTSPGGASGGPSTGAGSPFTAPQFSE